LKWSKILKYDFFRLYSQHLILYSPPDSVKESTKRNHENISLPKFRKNLYTQEIISFVLELIEDGKKSRQQVISDYCIPKTTLYKWIKKYSKI
jgi:hypothetical protein